MTIKNPIHTRLVFAGEEGEATRSIFCRKLERTVPLGVCEECPQRTSIDLRAGEVTCSTEVRASPKTADVRERAARTLVGAVMERRIACVMPDADLEMLQNLVRDDEAICVIDTKKRPLGIVTRSDVLRATNDGGVDSAREAMTPLVHSLVEDAPISFGIAMLALEDVSQVPVVTHEGVVVGMLRSRDLVRWLATEIGWEVVTPGA